MTQCMKQMKMDAKGKSKDSIKIPLDFFNRLNNISDAYQQWVDSTKAPQEPAASEKAKYSQEFEKLK